MPNKRPSSNHGFIEVRATIHRSQVAAFYKMVSELSELKPTVASKVKEMALIEKAIQSSEDENITVKLARAKQEVIKDIASTYNASEEITAGTRVSVGGISVLSDDVAEDTLIGKRLEKNVSRIKLVKKLTKNKAESKTLTGASFSVHHKPQLEPKVKQKPPSNNRKAVEPRPEHRRSPTPERVKTSACGQYVTITGCCSHRHKPFMKYCRDCIPDDKRIDSAPASPTPPSTRRSSIRTISNNSDPWIDSI